MQLSDILLIGIKNRRLESLLALHGYRSLSVDFPDTVVNFDRDFSLTIIDQSYFESRNSGDTEKIYFLNNVTPVLVLLHQISEIPAAMQKMLIEGTYDYLYEHEIGTGLAIKRIEKAALVASLDKYLCLMQSDVQERSRLEHELSLRAHTLQHEQKISASILSSIGHGILLIDQSGIIVMANEKAYDLTGTQNLTGSSFLMLPDPICAIIGSFIEQIAQRCKHIPARQCTRDKHILLLSAFPLLNCPHAKGTLLIISDITERESINSQLYQAEKLATVGTMLSGVAHELRNPLTIISGRTQRALSKLSTESEEWIATYFNSIDQQVRRCASIVNRVLDFTRVTANKYGNHFASELLEEALGYIAYQYGGAELEIRRQYDARLQICGDRSRLLQMLINIINNAAQAMNGAGILSISCEYIERDYGLITIGDTGPGINPENDNKIFDPFFTTKDPGQGTGLGLSISYKIAQQSNGTIWFTSSPGETKFFIKLPTTVEGLHAVRDITG